LERTLGYYRDPDAAVAQIPTLQMLTMKLNFIKKRAKTLLKMLEAIDNPRLSAQLVPGISKAGGGSFPTLELPSQCVGIQIQHMNANVIERYLREHHPPIIGRIEEDTFLMDLRTIMEDEFIMIQTAFRNLLEENA
jgi:L-seryl-tRNA(Ser) seleniumtransferase